MKNELIELKASYEGIAMEEFENDYPHLYDRVEQVSSYIDLEDFEIVVSINYTIEPKSAFSYALHDQQTYKYHIH